MILKHTNPLKIGSRTFSWFHYFPLIDRNNKKLKSHTLVFISVSFFVNISILFIIIYWISSSLSGKITFYVPNIRQKSLWQKEDYFLRSPKLPIVLSLWIILNFINDENTLQYNIFIIYLKK